MFTERRHVGLVYAFSCLSVFVVSFSEFVINIYMYVYIYVYIYIYIHTYI
jgi:hypothetical protein